MATIQTQVQVIYVYFNTVQRRLIFFLFVYAEQKHDALYCVWRVREYNNMVVTIGSITHRVPPPLCSCYDGAILTAANLDQLEP